MLVECVIGCTRVPRHALHLLRYLTGTGPTLVHQTGFEYDAIVKTADFGERDPSGQSSWRDVDSRPLSEK